MKDGCLDASVVVCAYTEARWNDLVAAIESLKRQSRPPREIILVIDHNPPLLERVRAEIPGVVALANSRPRGLSGARNTGIGAAQGRLIAFLDDDATAEPEWLALLAQHCDDPHVLGASGLVVPMWQGAKPRWFPEEFYWVPGCSYRGLPQDTAEVRNLYGGCACIRREVFATVGGFRPEIGRVGTRPLGGEETELCIRAGRHWPERTFLFEPRARIHHRIPPDRARWSYFCSRCFWEGFSKATIVRYVGAQHGLAAERAYTFRTLPRGVVQSLVDTLRRGDPAGLGRAGAIVAGLALTTSGYAAGALIQRFASRPAKRQEGVSPQAEQVTGQAGGARPLRVLQVTARYFPLTGGVETHVYEVARRLAQAGVDVTVLTSDPSGQLPAHEIAAGVEIRRVRAWPRTRDYYFAPGIYREIRRGQWDVIHCQCYHTLVAPLAMLAAWRSHTPYVLTFHSGGHSSGLRNALRGLQRKALRPLLARADRLIGVSDFEARFFQEQLRLPARQFTVIPNGSQLPVPPAGTAGPPAGSPLILSVGRLERYKGHHRIIAALPHILAQYPQARLRIVGVGPYEQALRQLAEQLGIADRVVIAAIPPADRQGMAALLAQASLVTLLSDYEAHPVSAMEALALGRPMLVTDTSGLRELAQRGLVRAIPLESSPQAIAAAVVQELRDPLVRPAVALPTWEGCTASLLALYENLGAEARTGRARQLQANYAGSV